jgi:hypothetical protein
VAAPLAASWPLGRIAYHANALALGQELALYGADTLHLTSAVQAESNAFLWGWGPVGHLFPMLWQSAQINSRVSTTVHADLPPSLAPWITPIAVCALVAILRLIPKPRRLIGFLIMALPSALALWSAIRADRGGRHLDSGFMLIPVILGVVWAELACRRSLVSSLSLRATALGYVLVMVVLLFATDIIDTPLSGYAAAPWMLGSSQEIVDTFVRAQTGILSLSEQWRPCDTGLAWDRSHGLLPSLPPFNNPQP